MHSNSRLVNEKGFSLIEMVITVTVMLVVTSAIVTLAKSSMKDREQQLHG